jgi:Amidases related to nicotinamidase
MKQVHIIVDMLNDFITGSLACNNAEEAVKQTVDYINKHKDMDVFYICDSHPKTHCSFTENGGTWPNHCVKGSFGGEIHELFYSVEKKVINLKGIILLGKERILKKKSTLVTMLKIQMELNWEIF